MKTMSLHLSVFDIFEEMSVHHKMHVLHVQRLCSCRCKKVAEDWLISCHMIETSECGYLIYAQVIL